jgi:hypothetical protein
MKPQSRTRSSRARIAWPAALCAVLGLAFGGAAGAFSRDDVLASCRIDRADLLLERFGRVLDGIGEAEGAAAPRADLGRRLRNPGIAGIDLAGPIEFLRLPGSTTWTCRVRDRDAMKWAMFFHAVHENAPFGWVRFKGDRAAWGGDADAALDALEIESGEPPEEGKAGVRVGIQVQRLLSAHEEAFNAQLIGMKERMRTALRGAPGGEAAARVAQKQLDRAVALVRQTARIDGAMTLTDEAADMAFLILPVPGSPFSLFTNRRSGPLTLMRYCPAEADLFLAYNLFPGSELGSLALSLFGIDVGTPGTDGGPEIDMAMFLSPEPGGPVELLDIRRGAPAETLRREWDAAEERLTSEQPFLLRRTAPPEGETATRLTQVVPNEKVLPESGVAIFRRLLGDVVLAARETEGDVTFTAVGRDPIQRLREARALAEHPEGALPEDRAFRQSLESLPTSPRALVYVSPEAIRRWLALGGLAVPAPKRGLALGLTLGGGRIEGRALVPTGFIAAPPAP